MIGATSRYRNALVQTACGPNGDTRQEMRVRFPGSRRIAYTYYRVIDKDRIDTIARDFYENPRLWWIIADANPEVMDWLDLRAGDIIRIPSG